MPLPSNANRANPVVFVVGCPRSGTTLLQRMLDAHSDLTVTNDTHFITRAAKRELRRSAHPELHEKLVQRVVDYHRFHRMGLERDEALRAAHGAADYADFVSRLYDLRAKQAGKTMAGEKTPDYCRKMPLLHRLFPQAKFLHIIRDGRDVTLSTLDWASSGKGPGRWDLWGRDAVGTCALWWRWQVGNGQYDGVRLGASVYHEVKYEALVDDPQGELLKICDFLEIPYDQRMPRFHEGKTRQAAGRSAKSAWLGPVSGLRNWREQMSSEDAALFDCIAGGVLDSAGYERESYVLNDAVRERTLDCVAWWSDRGRDVKGVIKKGMT